jgi:hypothetical protein
MNSIEPWPGFSNPEITLRRVDFPAPFDPIRVTVSFSGTSSETPDRA